MASVFKRPSSRYWYAAYRVPVTNDDGKQGWKQVKIVTKLTDRAKAQRAADNLEDEALRKAGAGDLLSSEVLGILKEATEKAMQKRLSIADGKAYLKKLTELATGEKLKVWSLKDWLDEWLREKQQSTKPSTLARYEHSVEMFVAHLGDKSNSPVDSITMDHLRGFRDKLHGEGRTAKTCNGYIKDVQAALKTAVEREVITRLKGGKIVNLPEDDSVERAPFTLEEFKKLVDAAPNDDWRGVILLGGFGGLRLGDASRLLAKNVFMDEKLIKFSPQKSTRTQKRGKKIIVLPMHPQLLSFFKDHKPPMDPEKHCFPHLCRVSIGGNKGLSTGFSKIMETAGVSRGQSKKIEEGKAGRTAHARSFHSLRHTFNSWMMNGGVSQEMRMKLVGHSDKESNDGYTHTEIESLRKAVQSVPDFEVR